MFTPLGPQLVRLLSVLLIELGKPVPASRLVEVLWGVPAPEAAAIVKLGDVIDERVLGSGVDELECW